MVEKGGRVEPQPRHVQISEEMLNDAAIIPSLADALTGRVALTPPRKPTIAERLSAAWDAFRHPDEH